MTKNRELVASQVGGVATKLIRPALGDAVIFITLVAVSLSTGLISASQSSYWSEAQVFQDFMNSPLRILFPIAVALLAGAKTAGEVSSRFIVNTRTRADIRLRIIMRIVNVALRSFTIFSLVTLVNAVVAFVIVPTIWPQAIDPQGYGLGNPTAVRDADLSVAPLTGLFESNPVALSLVASAWFGLHASLLGVITLIAVFLITKPVLALLFPLGLYMVESVVFQLIGMPGRSLLISAVYPAGLQNYDLTEAVFPTIFLAVVAIAGSAWLVSSSRTNSRMS